MKALISLSCFLLFFVAYTSSFDPILLFLLFFVASISFLQTATENFSII